MTTSLAATRLEHIRESIARTVDPLKEGVEAIEKDIARIEQEIEDYKESRQEEIKELRTAKNEALRMIRLSDPEYRKNGQQKKKPTIPHRGVETTKVAEEIEAYLLKNGDEGVTGAGVTIGDLEREIEGISRKRLTPAFQLLIENGVLRADKAVRGGHMSYRLVAPNG